MRGLKNVKTDMLCKPWYVGNLPYHIPNNCDITVDYKDGKVVLKEKCFAIAAVDAELAKTRAWEKKFKLNTGEGRPRGRQCRSGCPGAAVHRARLQLFGVDWEFLKPYIVLGLALGGVYALSGVGSWCCTGQPVS